MAPGQREASLPVLWAAATGEGLEALRRTWLYRLDAPTDDRPFFFNLLSLARLPELSEAQLKDNQATVLRSLLGLLLTVAALSLVCIALPLALAPRDLRPAREDRPLVAFFAAIGLGFMFVELALLQRLSLFLGHPAYGIGVALFSLLLASGAGSYLAGRKHSLAGPRVLGMLAALIALEALALPHLLALGQTAELPARLALCVAMLVPPGLLMGTAFPSGVRAAGAKPQILPWLWGINGAASVLASVLAAAVSLELGITANLWLGALCYVAAAWMLGLRAAPVPSH
jgi:hypothetical protein